MEYDSRVGYYHPQFNQLEAVKKLTVPLTTTTVNELRFKDQNQPLIWIPISLEFPISLELNDLQRGLEVALKVYPEFTGRLQPNDGSELNSSSQGSVKLVKSGCWFTTSNDDKYLDFQAAIYTILNHMHQAPLLAIKINYSPSLINCSPSLINYAPSLINYAPSLIIIKLLVCHLVADGFTISQFIKLWGQSITNPLISHLKSSDIKYDDEYKSINRIQFSKLLSDTTILSITMHTFPSHTKVSKEDLFITLMWRTLLRIKQSPSNKLTQCKRALKLPSHDGHFNNYVNVSTGKWLISDILEGSVLKIAKLLRNTIINYRTNPSTMINAPPSDPNLDLSCSSHRHFYTNLKFNATSPNSIKVNLNLSGLLLIQPTINKNQLQATFNLPTHLLVKLKEDGEFKSYLSYHELNVI